MSAHVYFLRQEGACGPVKIGCSQAPELRLESIRPWCPFPIEVAATIPGGYDLERRFHAKFLPERLHHEWFRGSPELTLTIAAIQAGSFDIDSLPSPRLLPCRVDKPRWTPEQRRIASIGHRIRSLEDRGAVVPQEIKDTYTRLVCGRFHRWYAVAITRRAEDLALAEAYMAEHWTPWRRAKKAA